MGWGTFSASEPSAKNQQADPDARTPTRSVHHKLQKDRKAKKNQPQPQRRDADETGRDETGAENCFCLLLSRKTRTTTITGVIVSTGNLLICCFRGFVDCGRLPFCLLLSLSMLDECIRDIGRPLHQLVLFLGRLGRSEVEYVFLRILYGD